MCSIIHCLNEYIRLDELGWGFYYSYSSNYQFKLILMKNKLIILSLILFTFNSKAQITTTNDFENFQKIAVVVELSLNPKLPTFCIYFNNILDIQSYKVEDKDIVKIFNYDDHIEKPWDNIWYSLHPTYYKLWDKPDSLLFIVKLPATRHDLLNNHLNVFLDILKQTVSMYMLIEDHPLLTDELAQDLKQSLTQKQYEILPAYQKQFYKQL